MDELSPPLQREVKQGRRAGNLFQASPPQGFSNESNTENLSNPIEKSVPQKPARKQGGWADDAKEKKKKGGKNKDDEFDERLTHDATIVLDNDTDDIPVIPDLEEFEDDDMAHQVAAPPSIQHTRVATYKELDHEFEKHAGLLTLDGDIDLKLLGSVLSPESEVFEEDKVWDWDRIFTEVASDLRSEWENKVVNESSDVLV